MSGVCWVTVSIPIERPDYFTDDDGDQQIREAVCNALDDPRWSKVPFAVAADEELFIHREKNVVLSEPMEDPEVLS